MYISYWGGILQKNIQIEIRKSILIVIPAVSMFILSVYGRMCQNVIGEYYNIAGTSYACIITLICVISVFYLFKKVKIKNDQAKFLINTMGQNTLGIYLLHIPLGYIMIRIFSQIIGMRISGGFFSIIFCGFLTIISLLLTLIIKEVPILKEILSI